MNLHEFRLILKQTLLVPVLVLLVLAGVLTWQIQVTIQEQRTVDHSDRVIAQIDELHRLIVDEDTGLRGYQLTADPTMLAPYNTARHDLPAHFDNLQNLESGQSAQLMRLSRIRERYSAWQGFAQSVLALEAGDAAVEDPKLNRVGKVELDQVRAGINDMLTAEASLRDERNNFVHKRVQQVLTAVVVAALAAGILLGFFTRSRLHLVSTAYRQSMEEARQREEDLFQSRQWFQTTLESIGDGVISCDVGSRVRFMNPAAEQMTGWQSLDAVGQPLSRVFRIVSDDTREPRENPVDRARSQNKFEGQNLEPEGHTLLLSKDGRELLVDESAAPIRDRGEAMIGVVLVFRDMTDIRRTEAALIAGEKLAVAGRLAASIAHEIHNPLDSVANLHFLMGQTNDQTKRAEYLGMAQQELGRTLQISNTMLSLYREPKAPVPVELKEMLGGVLLLLDRQLAMKGIEVVREFPSSPVEVQAFPAELRQVFTNLIVNAMDAVGKSGKVSVRVLDTDDDEKHEHGGIIEIADSGPGVSENIEKNLFQPFFTTKGEQGTGLGLWVSMGIVQKHGGTIRIKNGTRQGLMGAVVRVYLPARTMATAASRSTPHLV